MRGGVLDQKNELRPYLVVSVLSAGISSVCKAKNILLLVENKECMRKMRSFDRGLLSPAVDTDVLHVII